MIERAVREAARAASAAAEPCVVATVVRVHGSAYRRPGARMLLTRDGWVAGSVSGGCLESDVVRRAWWLTEQRPAVVTYDSTIAEAADIDELRAAFGLGCGGIVEILLERREPGAPLDPFTLADAWIAAQRRGAIATVFAPAVRRVALADDGTLIGDASPALRAALAHALATGDHAVGTYAGPDGDEDALIEAICPPPRLFVFGTGHDAVPVVRFARALGWDTLVCAPHATHGLRERFREADDLVIGDAEDRVDAADRAVALVMSHDVALDRDHLAMLLGTRATYIGVLGPIARTRRILDELGVADRDREARLHAPVGLELGAESPEEIALSIVSEVQAVLARAPATSLREHVGPIHARAS